MLDRKPHLDKFIYCPPGAKPLELFYLVGGSGYPVFLLHGWGCSSETMLPLFNHLCDDFRVYNFDLPGFGMSSEPPWSWGTTDYADMLAEFIKEICLSQPPLIIGHSFGGRLALRLGARGLAKKMLLTGCAGIPPKRGMDYYAKVYSYKAAKKLLTLPGLSKRREELLNAAKNKSGSEDYRNASEIMRGVFVNTVNEDQTPNLPKIDVPTLLFWGENDTATPLCDGEMMAEKMQDAALIVKKGGTHFAFLEYRAEFLAIADSLFKAEKQGDNCK